MKEAENKELERKGTLGISTSASEETLLSTGFIPDFFPTMKMNGEEGP